jgi:hypothetical protein
MSSLNGFAGCEAPETPFPPSMDSAPRERRCPRGTAMSRSNFAPRIMEPGSA